MEKLQMIVVSTGHIREEDRDIFDSECSMQNENGYLVYVSNVYKNPWKSLHSNYQKIVDLCIKEDCRYIMFDCDGPFIDGLEIFQW